MKAVGVHCQFGHTTKEPMECKGCARRWDQPREKETDINIALAIYDDAYQDVFDTAFVVTADTDQAATFRAIRARFPEKRIFTVTPPGRMPSKHLIDLSHGKVRLVEDHIDQCALPRLVMKEGQRTIMRPPEYDPPEGWVHPSERPK